MLAAGHASVLVQLRFHAYHYAALVPGMTLLALAAASDVLSVVRPDARGRAAVALAALVALAYPLAGRRARGWWAATREAALVVARVHEPRSFLATFKSGVENDAGESLDVARWLREHTRPDDVIADRGFAPEIYALAGLRYPGRFFWTSGYTDFLVAYRGVGAWREEDRQALASAAPRWLVTSVAADAPESPRELRGAGYVAKATIGTKTIFERREGAPRPATAMHGPR